MKHGILTTPTIRLTAVCVFLSVFLCSCAVETSVRGTHATDLPSTDSTVLDRDKSSVVDTTTEHRSAQDQVLGSNEPSAVDTSQSDPAAQSSSPAVATTSPDNDSETQSAAPTEQRETPRTPQNDRRIIEWLQNQWRALVSNISNREWGWATDITRDARERLGNAVDGLSQVSSLQQILIIASAIAATLLLAIIFSIILVA